MDGARSLLRHFHVLFAVSFVLSKQVLGVATAQLMDGRVEERLAPASLGISQLPDLTRAGELRTTASWARIALTHIVTDVLKEKFVAEVVTLEVQPLSGPYIVGLQIGNASWERERENNHQSKCVDQIKVQGLCVKTWHRWIFCQFLQIVGFNYLSSS